MRPADARLGLRARPQWSRMRENRAHLCDSSAKRCTKKFCWMSQSGQRKNAKTLDPAPYTSHHELYLVIGSKRR